jgi:hypothetical protein
LNCAAKREPAADFPEGANTAGRLTEQLLLELTGGCGGRSL